MTTANTPFVYPRNIHKRKHAPPVYLDYRRYKSILKDEFDNKCVYCRIPDGFMSPTAFGVDHYKPKKKFHSLECTYSNLYYCCSACNSRKGDYWPNSTQVRAGMIVVNPCDHLMSDHVAYYGSSVRAKSYSGKFMVEYLDLNETDRQEYRRDLLTAIGQAMEGYKRVRATVRVLNKRLQKERDETVRDEYARELENHSTKLNQIKGALFRLTADRQFKV
jgi:HNH endonuclease